jgi:hypothetical protein
VDVLPILLLLLGVAVVIVVAVLSYQADKKRRALLASFALSNGWTYVARDDGWCERFEGTPFGEGDNRKADNVLRGPYSGTEMVAFEYSYQTHSTDSKGNRSTSTHRFAVCVLELRAALPRLELSPETAMSRLAGHLGFGDVELESEDFNRHYRVGADDPKFAYDVLNPRTMEALLARPALHIRLDGTDAVCWDSGRLDPADLLARLSTLQLVITGIPSFVWSDRAPFIDNPPIDNPPVDNPPAEHPPGGASA